MKRYRLRGELSRGPAALPPRLSRPSLGVLLQQLGWPLRTLGRERWAECLPSPKTNSGSDLTRCPGKGRSQCWDRVWRQAAGSPFTDRSVFSWNPAEARESGWKAPKAQGALQHPGRQAPLGLRGQVPESLSLSQNHRGESGQQGGLEESSGRVPRKANKSPRQRPGRIAFLVLLF